SGRAASHRLAADAGGAAAGVSRRHRAARRRGRSADAPRSGRRGAGALLYARAPPAVGRRVVPPLASCDPQGLARFRRSDAAPRHRRGPGQRRALEQPGRRVRAAGPHARRRERLRAGRSPAAALSGRGEQSRQRETGTVEGHAQTVAAAADADVRLRARRSGTTAPKPWRRRGRGRVTHRAHMSTVATEVPLDRLVRHAGKVLGGRPLTFESTPQQWAYTASVPLALEEYTSQAIDLPIRISADVTVDGGTLGCLLVAEDWVTLLGSTPPSMGPGRHRVNVIWERGTSVANLVFRNHSENQPTVFRVESVQVEPAPPDPLTRILQLEDVMDATGTKIDVAKLQDAAHEPE